MTSGHWSRGKNRRHRRFKPASANSRVQTGTLRNAGANVHHDAIAAGLVQDMGGLPCRPVAYREMGLRRALREIVTTGHGMSRLGNIMPARCHFPTYSF